MSIYFWAAVFTVISAIIAAITLYFAFMAYRAQLPNEAKQKERHDLIVPEYIRKQKPQQSKRKIILGIAITASVVFLVSMSVLIVLKPNPIRTSSNPAQFITKTSIGVAKTATWIAAENATATAPAQPIAAYNQYPPYTGKTVMDDPLQDNSHGNGWQTFSGLGANRSNACEFSKLNGYEVQTTNSNDCYSTKEFPANLGLQLDMEFLSGTCGGIFIHRFISGKASNHFAFYICKDGSFEVFIFPSPNNIHLVSSGVNQAIQATRNVLAIVANDNNIDFYVNFQPIYNYRNTDPTSFQKGLVGVSAIARDGNKDDILFSNAVAWAL